MFHIFINIEVNRDCFKSFFIFSFEFQVNVLSSDIIYESENLSNTTDEEIHYDSESSVSDSGNSFENENEEHLVTSTASGTEMLFLVGGRSKFGRTIRYSGKKVLLQIALVKVGS